MYARARVPPAFLIGYVSGVPGERFTPREVARAWGVDVNQVYRWIERGWLRASKTRLGYRIRMRALRRAVMDHHQVSDAVLRAKYKQPKVRKRSEQSEGETGGE